MCLRNFFYDSCARLRKLNEPVSFLTLQTQLKQDGKGDRIFLISKNKNLAMKL